MICLMTVFEPKECKSCESAQFCSSCINEYINQNGSQKCPHCQQVMNLGDWHKFKMNQLNKTDVKCMQPQCLKRGQLTKYELFVKYHADYCVNSKSMKCPIGCGLEVTKLSSEEHLETCQKKLIKCYLCLRVHQRDQTMAHQQECPEVAVTCKDCNRKVKRKHMRAHIQRDCTEAIINCKQCMVPVKRNAYDEHLETCPETEIECKQCFGILKLKEQNTHNCWKYFRQLIHTVQLQNNALVVEN